MKSKVQLTFEAYVIGIELLIIDLILLFFYMTQMSGQIFVFIFCIICKYNFKKLIPHPTAYFRQLSFQTKFAMFLFVIQAIT